MTMILKHIIPSRRLETADCALPANYNVIAEDTNSPDHTSHTFIAKGHEFLDALQSHPLRPLTCPTTIDQSKGLEIE